jgi:xylose dehydrogenase (NAD/NADP)
MEVTPPLRWGLLSTARINRLVIPGLHASPAAELVAVASRDAARAEDYAREWRIPRAYGSYDALLADPAVDAVYVSLPNALHVEWSIRALEAGKHVLCEKPLARVPAEVVRAFDAADRAERILMEAFMWRFHPQTRELLAVLEELGQLTRIESSFGFTVSDPRNVRLSCELAGGALMDVGCYCVSASRLIAGEPEYALGRQEVGGDRVDVHFDGTLLFAGGVEAHFECGLELADVDTLRVVGEDGEVFLDDPWHARDPLLELRDRKLRVEPIDAYRAEIENVARAARGIEAPLLDRDDALGQARAIDALYTSAEAGGEPIPVAR